MPQWPPTEANKKSSFTQNVKTFTCIKYVGGKEKIKDEKEKGKKHFASEKSKNNCSLYQIALKLVRVS